MKTYTVTFSRGVCHDQGGKQYRYEGGSTHTEVPQCVVDVIRANPDRSDRITENLPAVQPVTRSPMPQPPSKN